MEFVISVWVQAAKTVAASVIGITASHRIGAHVFQKDNAARERAFGLVRHHAAHRAELPFALLVLSHANRSKKRENHRQTANASSYAHPLPPEVGCIRNTMLSSFSPAFGSTVRVCSANPFAWITIS